MTDNNGFYCLSLLKGADNNDLPSVSFIKPDFFISISSVISIFQWIETVNNEYEISLYFFESLREFVLSMVPFAFILFACLMVILCIYWFETIQDGESPSQESIFSFSWLFLIASFDDCLFWLSFKVFLVDEENQEKK